MSTDTNAVFLVGTVDADPKFAYTNSGKMVANLRVSTTETRDGKTYATWHTVAVWGDQAKALEGKVHRGARIFINGKLSTRSYEKDGEKKYVTEVQAFRADLISEGAPIAYVERQPTNAQPRQAASAQVSMADYSDDIPF